MRYYNETDRSFFTVDEGWPSQLRDATVEMLLSKGYLPIVETQNAIVAPSMFVEYEERFTKSDDGTAFRKSDVAIPTPVAFDRDKFYALVDEVPGGSDALSELVSDDDEARDFWFDPVYLRGSSMAQKLCSALGMTQDQVEGVVARSV